jgi:phosphoribosylformimino-5-aminoimidazole carboxamide ribonucleotide (ProFAR) isomerase
LKISSTNIRLFRRLDWSGYFVKTENNGLAAIDLLEGKVVRLRKGRPDDAKVYSTDPVSTARGWAQSGADGLHVVDLDATLGKGNNQYVSTG